MALVEQRRPASREIHLHKAPIQLPFYELVVLAAPIAWSHLWKVTGRAWRVPVALANLLAIVNSNQHAEVRTALTSRTVH
jgi:hypothetical protein